MGRFEYLVVGTGGKGKDIMKRKIHDANMPVGKLKKVKDFLPSPEELVTQIKTIKITISLSQSSVDFFKCQAEYYHTKYQKMIREVVDKYAMRYSKK